MPGQNETSSGSLRASRWRSWLLAPIVWIVVNLMFGWASYIPLVLAYLSLLHYFGPPGYHQLDIPGVLLVISTVWLLLLVPVFVWVNLKLCRRLSFPRWVVWAGAIFLLLSPAKFEILFS